MMHTLVEYRLGGKLRNGRWIIQYFYNKILFLSHTACDIVVQYCYLLNYNATAELQTGAAR